MKKELNLAILKKKQEELTKNDKTSVRAGRSSCYICGDECTKDVEYGFYSTQDAIYRARNSTSAPKCTCGSIFVFFGLSW